MIKKGERSIVGLKKKNGTSFYCKKLIAISIRRNLDGVKNGIDIADGAWEPLIAKGLQSYVKKKMKSDVYDEKIDVNGRYISFKIKYGEACYQIVNIYAPVDEYERVKFINEISSSIIDGQDENTEIIIGGITIVQWIMNWTGITVPHWGTSDK